MTVLIPFLASSTSPAKSGIPNFIMESSLLWTIQEILQCMQYYIYGINLKYCRKVCRAAPHTCCSDTHARSLTFV